MPTTMLVNHRVTDYDAWKPHCDRSMSADWTKDVRHVPGLAGPERPRPCLRSEHVRLARGARRLAATNPMLHRRDGRRRRPRRVGADRLPRRGSGRKSLVDDEPVAVDGLEAARPRARSSAAPGARDALARTASPSRADELDRVARARTSPSQLDDADREQAAAAVDDGAARAPSSTTIRPAAGFAWRSQSRKALAPARPSGVEARAAALARDDRAEHVGAVARRR